MSIVEDFNAYRARMNERILRQDNKVIKRFWSLDHQAYQSGALDAKTKELLPDRLFGTALRRLRPLPLGPMSPIGRRHR
jgi:hypothetical protein